MKLGKCMVVTFFSLIATLTCIAQSKSPTEPAPSQTGHRQLPTLVPRIFQQQPGTTDTEQSDSPYFKGKARFVTLRRDMTENVAGSRKATGAVAKRSMSQEGDEEGKKNMPFWQGSFNFLGADFPFRMVGTNPAKGSVATRVPVAVVPLDLTFGDGTELSASQTACGDTQSPVARILQSPLFQSSSIAVGGTFIGRTQYIDAFQRANFWSDVSTTSPDYHVLLNATAASTQSFTLPVTQPRQFPVDSTVAGPCARIGFEDMGDLDARVQNVINAQNIPGDVLPIFVMYNTFATQNGGCCVLGYHSVTFDTKRHPYVVTSYSDPNLFNKPIEDIHALSHELGEWMDDPFVRSLVPSWGNVGQDTGSCSLSLEVGDPVTGIATTITMNGFTYHPEDLVFLPWFSRQTPSTSVNGQFTLLNSFSAPPKICGQ